MNFPDGRKNFHGSEVTLFKAIAEYLNFDYIINEPRMSHGFSGMMTELSFGFSDVGWSQLYLSEFKWGFMDMTTSYGEDKACLMVSFRKQILRILRSIMFF